jgi:L-asparaginase
MSFPNALPEASVGVTVFGLGGTIAMRRSDGGGAVPALSPAELVEAVPGLAESGIDVDVVDFRQVPGASVTFADVDALVAEIGRCPSDGIVVTQGTDTIEETSYLIDISYGGPKPVVVTGAMRNPSLAGPDGPANLLAAIQVAASPAAAGMGALVVFHDEIHAARRVRKTHTASPGTFRSPNGGPLGYVVEGDVRLLARVDNRTVVPASGAARVALVTLGLDDDGVLLEGLADRVDGVVVAALGAGHVPFGLVDPLVELVGRVPVVLASRTGAGSVLTRTYGFPGSESDLVARGLIPAGFLDPAKARVLLRRLLAGGADAARVRAAFAVAGGYADPGTWPW